MQGNGGSDLYTVLCGVDVIEVPAGCSDFSLP